MNPHFSLSLTQSETTTLLSDFEELENTQVSNTTASSFYCADEKNTCTKHLLEDVIFAQNGYKKLNKICDTLQGELYKAEVTKSSTNAVVGSYVAIKKTDTDLCKQKIAIQDGMNFCVDEDILKEAITLKHLTIDNQPAGDYIIKYVDFFVSDSAYYLVMEYIEGITLKSFVNKSHKLMKDGKLSLHEYSKSIKYIMFQLIATIRWLHEVFNCCHLDICLNNIMIINADFMETQNGLKLNNKLSIKLGDFGLAEVFDNSSFKCNKQGPIENMPYVAPQIHENDIYDAQSADMWSFGMILYECIVGKSLYKAEDMWDPQNGYLALTTNQLQNYLATHNVINYFNRFSLLLLVNLLQMDENKRISAAQVIRHRWFSVYYKRYKKRMTKKLINDKDSVLKQTEKMKNICAFYSSKSTI